MLGNNTFALLVFAATPVYVACGGHLDAPPLLGGGAGVSQASGGQNAVGGGGASGNPASSGGFAAAGSSATGDVGLKDYLGDPAYPDTFWQTATFAASNIDPAPFQQGLTMIAGSGWEIHSLLVARNGRVVFERYS